MPIYIWLPIVILSLVFICVILYSFDRRHYKNASRRAAANAEHSNNTVVYTIPTTGQLNAAYPDLPQTQYPNQLQRPPSYVSSGESPPSYDQAISSPTNQPVGLVIK